MRTVRYVWPLANTTAVAALQTLAGAGSLSLNGSLAPSHNTDKLPITMDAVRTVSLTSVNNLGGVNFTITGTTDGFPATEVLAGPNNNTVYSVNDYDTVTSIKTSAAANAVSAGTGTTGHTPYMLVNSDNDFFNMAVNTFAAGTITYSLSTIIVPNNDISTSLLIVHPVAGMIGANNSQVGSFTVPCNYATISVTASDGTGTIIADFLQQGIR